MSARRRYNLKMYPTPSQEKALSDIKGACQRLHNAALEQRKFAYKRRGVSVSRYDQEKELKTLRAELPEYKAVHSHVLQGVIKRLDLAFKRFFKAVKAGDAHGYPRFKSFDRYRGWTYKQYTKGWKLARTDQGQPRSIKLHGVDHVRLRGSLPQEGGRPKTCTISHRGGCWYASVVFEYDDGELTCEGGEHAWGLDWGCEKFVSIADRGGGSSHVPNPRHLKAAKDKLTREQRRLSRKTRGSNNRRKQARRVARVLREVADRRRDFLHKTSTWIVRACALIAVEKLNVKGMPSGAGSRTASGGVYKTGLNKSILDTAPAAFHNMLNYKASSARIQHVVINTRRVKPSQTCSCCGHQTKKTLADRVHRCASCGFTCDRDVNAARVILSWALTQTPNALPVPQDMGKQPEPHAQGTLAKTAGCSGR